MYAEIMARIIVGASMAVIAVGVLAGLYVALDTPPRKTVYVKSGPVLGPNDCLMYTRERGVYIMPCQQGIGKMPE